MFHRKNINLLILVVFYFLLSVLGSKIRKIEVKTKKGWIRGEKLKPAWSADYFHAFKRIGYGAPPQGAMKFQPSVEPAMWLGILNATEYPPGCIQNDMATLHSKAYKSTFGKFYEYEENEACLYLNVFAPAPLMNETYPVIVWIHGGGFQVGSSNDYRQEPILKNFVSRKVVFVTLNYRLGPLGFLSTGDKVVPGNNGLWDIILALNWVKNNIEPLGGDPRHVTLMGHGSGAAAASILALSPQTEGLFHRLILLSGTAISPGMVRSVAVNATDLLHKHLGCLTNNSTQMLECLKTRSNSELISPDRPVLLVYYDDYNEWVPIIDGAKGIIPENILNMAKSHHYYHKKTPILLGTTQHECGLSLMILGKNDVNMTTLSAQSTYRLVENLTDGYTEFRNHQLIKRSAYHEYVLTKLDPTFGHHVLRDSMIDLYSDFWYHAPAAKLAEIYASADVPVYLYSFDHLSDSIYPEDTDWRGVFHGADLIYLFELTAPYLQRNRNDQLWQVHRRAVEEEFADMLTNFAKSGNPTPRGSQVTTNWTRFRPEQMNYLSITDSPKMMLGYHWRAHKFWNYFVQELDNQDIEKLETITLLKKELGDFQIATWVLLSSALFFFTVLIGLACYCMRKDSEEEEEI